MLLLIMLMFLPQHRFALSVVKMSLSSKDLHNPVALSRISITALRVIMIIMRPIVHYVLFVRAPCFLFVRCVVLFVRCLLLFVRRALSPTQPKRQANIYFTKFRESGAWLLLPCLGRFSF